MDKAQKCPYCRGTLEKKHPLVDYAGGVSHGTATWKCEEAGMLFKKELTGQLAEKAQKEYLQNKENQIISDQGGWVEVKKVFRILQKFLPWI